MARLRKDFILLFGILTLFLLGMAGCGTAGSSELQATVMPSPPPPQPTTPPPTVAIATPTPDSQATPENLAPDFTAVNLLTGETFSLSDFRGKIVFLNFWGSWCPPCRMEMPAFEEVYETYKDQVVVIGVGVNDSEANLLGFAKEKGITYPIVWDRTSEVARKYRIRSLPTTYRIDQQGVMTGVAVGALNKEQLVKAIEAMLNAE